MLAEIVDKEIQLQTLCSLFKEFLKQLCVRYGKLATVFMILVISLVLSSSWDPKIFRQRRSTILYPSARLGSYLRIWSSILLAHSLTSSSENLHPFSSLFFCNSTRVVRALWFSAANILLIQGDIVILDSDFHAICKSGGNMNGSVWNRIGFQEEPDVIHDTELKVVDLFDLRFLGKVHGGEYLWGWRRWQH